MKRNQIPDIVNSDPYYRGSSRYPAQAVPNPAVRYAANQSKAMTLANTRNAVGPLQVNDRPRNESLEEYRTGRAPEAIHQDSMYYQAHIAHLQAMLARERVWSKQLLFISAVIFVIMALLILYFARRPAGCEHTGHRFHIPIFSPFSSSHEKETSLQAGYSLTGVVLLVLSLVIAWQNRAYISSHVLKGIWPYVQSILS